MPTVSQRANHDVLNMKLSFVVLLCNVRKESLLYTVKGAKYCRPKEECMKIYKFLGAGFFSIIFAVATGVHAGTPELETHAEAPTKIGPRESFQYLVSVSYSAIDFPIPSKFGLTAGLITSPDQTWELEYMRGSYSVPGGFRDLGSLTDSRLSVIGRTYYGNSFHLSYGMTYFSFNAQVGDKLMNVATGGTYPSMNALDVQGLGLNVGIGNIWTFRKNITVGIDWLSIAQPIYSLKRSSDYLKYATDAEDKRSVEESMKVISYLPRFAAVNFHVGMLF